MEITDFNHRQQVFLASLLKYRAQGKRAAVALAADDSGISYGRCRDMVTEPDIKGFLEAQTAEQIAEITKETKVTHEFIIKGYERIAQFDFSKQFDSKTKEKLHITEQDKNTRMCDGATLKDVRGALDSLARINGMFNDKLQLGVTFKDILDEVGDNDGSDEVLVGDDE